MLGLMKADIEAERRSKLCAWARANGLNPDEIDENFQIADERWVRYRAVDDVSGTPAWKDCVSLIQVPPFRVTRVFTSRAPGK